MKPLQQLAVSMGLPILLGVAVLGYIGWRGKAAKLHVENFCGQLQVGDSIDGLADSARGANLSVHEFPEHDGKGSLLVEDGVLLARHFCTLDYEQRKITRRELSFLD